MGLLLVRRGEKEEEEERELGASRDRTCVHSVSHLVQSACSLLLSLEAHPLEAVGNSNSKYESQCRSYYASKHDDDSIIDSLCICLHAGVAAPGGTRQETKSVLSRCRPQILNIGHHLHQTPLALPVPRAGWAYAPPASASAVKPLLACPPLQYAFPLFS